MTMTRDAKPGKVKYPMATVAFYGPDDQQASKLVAAIFAEPGQAGALRKWQVKDGDIRENAAVTEEVTTFLKENNVVESVITEQIIGCPHEEGIDYPSSGVCPTCSFWWNVSPTRANTSRGAKANPKTGRNDPCPCGSGKKYKKCCAAAVKT